MRDGGRDNDAQRWQETKWLMLLLGVPHQSHQLFVLDSSCNKVHQISCEVRGSRLVGNMLSPTELPGNSLPYCIAVANDVLCYNDMRLDSGGVFTMSLSSNAVTQLVVAPEAYGVVPLACGYVYTDTTHRQVRFIAEDGNTKIRCGTGTAGSIDGVGTRSKFAQPTCVCAEGKSLFITDTSARAVKLVTCVNVLRDYLLMMCDIYKTFTIHCDVIGVPDDNIARAITSMIKVETFLQLMVRDNAKLQNNTKNTLGYRQHRRFNQHPC